MSELAGTSTRSESDPPDVDVDARPNKRKKREHLNCAECRRLKLRCDRKVPCDNCIKRSCQDLCPDGAREGKKRVSTNELETRELRKQVDSLVELLGHHGVRLGSTNTTKPAAGGMSDSLQHPPIPANSACQPSTSQAPLDRSPSRPSTSTYPAHAPQPQAPEAEYDTSYVPNHSNPANIASTSTAHAFEARGNSAFPHHHQPSFPPAQPPQLSSSFETNHLDGSPSEPFGNSLVRHTTVLSPADEPSHGTLVISASGRSKYLGPSAASEWLKDQEVIEASRPPSPRTANHSGLASPTRDSAVGSFPFTSAQHAHSLHHLLGCLPPKDEADTLIDAYFRYFGWSYEIVTRKSLSDFAEKAYIAKAMMSSTQSFSRVDVQQLGSLFAVLALGASHNLELSPDDQIAEDYCEAARNCLVKGNFMVHSTLAGVQTLALIAHYQLQTDRGRDGDSAWPLWGLAMRIAQAMGLHRDGGKWNLPDEVVEDRRRVFWEAHAAEVFQANCFSRPSSIAPEFVDTAFPQSGTGYHALKFELCKISDAVLYSALRVDGTSYERVCELYQQLCAFERRIPFDLRCRTALVSLPSAYPDTHMAEAQSPPLNRRDLRRTFEQHWLALIVSETIVNLNRPFFIKALVERSDDPTRTAYGQAFLSVLERSNVLIQIVCTLYGAYPGVTARHWWCWYHAFNSAVCMGTLLLMSPQNDFAPIALQQIDQVITAYTSVVQSRTSPRLVQNLRWLLRLRQRAVDRMANAQHENRDTGPSTATGSIDETIELDAGLLGWRTRFIERLGNNSQKATTISMTTPPGISPFDIDKVIQSMPRAVQEHVAADTLSAPDPNFATTSNDHLLNSTDQLLHQFWDPTLFLQGASGQDMDAGTNGLWDWLNQSGPSL